MKAFPLIALVGFVSTPLISHARTPATTTIVAGNARFQFLTPALVRPEYAPSGRFVDEPTALVQQRDWPAVDAQSSKQNGWLVAHTRAISLRYRLNSGPFKADNLEVSWAKSGDAPHRWHPGQIDAQNPGGLTYLLDHVGLCKWAAPMLSVTCAVALQRLAQPARRRHAGGCWAGRSDGRCWRSASAGG